MLKRLSLALISILTVAGISAYAGMWTGFPIVNGGSYCSSTVNGVCQNTVAAGPALTGNETVPADTNATGGSAPQTVLLSMADLGAQPITVSAALTGNTNNISASNVSGGYLFTATGTISTVNLTLPASPVNGQKFRLSANRTITTLAVTAGGTASMGGNSAPTVLTASTTAPQGYTFMYNSADTSWYRLQ